ncbi:pentatricopeptide repeat-containing protein At2g02750 [Phoenix dactylifera]|uniref:Pentatricopeptide repeat-containing protein At2g02750 n=1 Tax=Phoenix dactylifera TaxID=42345 RepID=A0A8B7BXM4_PHODC|nr:pentatricopeptide repeat-containing protein At2g02750 [Phoenix dactylifera]
MRREISKLVSNGRYREALSFYARIHAASIQPDSFTFPFLLKSCGNLQSIPQARQLHAHIIRCGFETHIYTATALTGAYMKLRLLQDALKMFDRIPNPTLPSFNAIISGFSQCGHFEESLRAFKRLRMEGFRPNSVTIASVLPACGTSEQGKQLHGLSIKMGHESDGYVATALLTMYSNCADLGPARRVFALIDEKNIVSYNAMISGFLRNGAFSMALDLFREVTTLHGQQTNSSTLLSILSACSKLLALLLGKQIHCYYLKYEVGDDVKIETALLDMYCKCGSVELADRVFSKIKDRNLVTWNTMISGLLSNGCPEIAMKLFHRLRSEGFKPDMTSWNVLIYGFSQQGNVAEAFRFFSQMQLEGAAHPSLDSITSLLQACSSISDLQHGKEIHCHVIRTRADYGDEYFQTALIDLYMKCGRSLHARRIFGGNERKSGDPALWNAIISGYGKNGENGLALEIFRIMREQKVEPNSATFLVLLSVCSHTGQVEKGWELFKMMSRDYGINPTAKHFGCMVDLLSRAGKLAEAWKLIQEIPEPSASVYSSLLGACGCYSDAALATVMADRLSKLEPKSPTPLVILSNIYAGQGRWNDVGKLRKMMLDRGLYKVPGCSWIGAQELQLT